MVGKLRMKAGFIPFISLFLIVSVNLFGGYVFPEFKSQVQQTPNS